MIKQIYVVSQLTKVPFLVVLDESGEKPLVEFFDARYYHTMFGQPTGGKYFAETLLGLDGFGREIGLCGLCLQGDVPQWTIDPQTCKLIVAWLKNNLKE